MTGAVITYLDNATPARELLTVTDGSQPCCSLAAVRVSAVRFVKLIAVSSAEPGGTSTIVHPRPPHQRSRPRGKGRNVPGISPV